MKFALGRKILAAGLAGALLLIVAVPLNTKAADNEVLNYLTVACDRENNARERYISFIDLANREHHKSLASLYRAVAAAKAVHIRNYKTLLKSLGASAKTNLQDPPELNSIKLQLENALNEEDFKCKTMYPDLMARLDKTNIPAAILAFYFGKVIAEEHASLFREALNTRESWKPDRIDFHICPICGHTVRGTPTFEKCPVCGTPAMSYLTVN
jgi:rubrerythrin